MNASRGLVDPRTQKLGALVSAPPGEPAVGRGGANEGHEKATGAEKEAKKLGNRLIIALVSGMILCSPALQAQTCYWVGNSWVCSGESPTCYPVGGAWVCK